MNNREADKFYKQGVHPPACTCKECSIKRTERIQREKVVEKSEYSKIFPEIEFKKEYQLANDLVSADEKYTHYLRNIVIALSVLLITAIVILVVIII
jgi:hypothetical protein